MPSFSVMHGWGGELAAFLLAASCAGCGEPGRLLCRACTAELAPVPRVTATRAGLTVHAALAYEGIAARCIRRLKGEGDTLLARPLGAALGTVLHPLIDPCTWIVPVPTSRSAFRRRGYRVPDLLIRRAGERPQRVLTVGRRPVDQRGLDAGQRAANVRGSIRSRRVVEGARVVLVDDVVTTGATLDEAARALDVAGFRVMSAVALAATPRRAGFGADSSATPGRHGETGS
ncbi:ComF family protein [Microbacterium sp. 179-I 3D3 NHS]|uniref:ComF family protein n=1 Tax=Microbacterium sp. 179-I 3D3 NHS TaxID=3142382 RepID=UPI00399F3344